MNYRILLVKGFFVLLISSLYAEDMMKHKEGDIVLESPVIKIIDGMRIGIDGNRIGFMLQIRREVRKIHLGVPNKVGGFTGIYSFNNAYYSVRQLTEIEHEMIESNDQEGLESLRPALEKAKNDFVQQVMHFLSSAQGAKGQMFTLIEESCSKRKRFDSLLLRWAAAREGDEERQFKEDIVSFAVFDIFCIDLINFLEDLMRSCPKAWAQFQQLLLHKDSGR